MAILFVGHMIPYASPSPLLPTVTFSHDSTHLASASNDETVKIWDVSSGDCLQTLSIGIVLKSISFDTTGSYLYTDVSTIAVDIYSASSIIPRVTDPQNP